jgi:TP901 family phage tail tape measure protein/lambda family phage tail tape measure protein
VSVVANVAINVDSRNAVSKLRQVQTQSQQTERAVEGLSRAFGGLAAAFGAGFALTKVIADVKELDTNLRRLGTVGGNVAALDKGLGALSDRLDGVANKAELAAASYQALSAGFTETGANLRVVEAATKAAVGGLADITGVVDVTTKVLNSYNMSGDQAAKVTDSISKAVELGQVQWSDYTSQLGRVASIAAIAGVSLDEVNAFVAAATKNGATAEVAFTGLGASLATIIKPTKESAKAAQALGINWTLAGLRGEGFESLMNQLAKAMESNTEKATEMVGGQEAVRGAFAAAAKGGKDYAMILEGLGGAAGKTDADFQTMKGSLENTLKALDTSFKNLSEALGTAFGPTVVATINQTAGAVNGIATAINEMPQPLKTATAETVKLIAQFLLLQKAIQITIGLQTALAALTIQSSKLSVATTAGSSAFALYANNAAALAPKVTGVSAVLGNLKLAMLAIPGAGWTAAAIIGLGLLAKAVFDTNETFRNFVKNIGGVVASDFRSAVDGMADDAKDSAANIQKAYEELPPGLSPIAKFIRELFEGAFKDTSNAAETSATASSNAFADFFNGLVSQGAAAFNGLSSLIANWWNVLPGPIRNILGGNAASVLAGAAGAAGSAASRASAPNAQATGIYGRYGAPSSQVSFATPTPVANAMNTPLDATVGGGGAGSDKAANDAKRAEEEAKRLAEQIREQTKAAESLKIQQQGSLAILRSSNDFEKAFVEFSVKRTEIQRRYSELTLASKSDEERKLLTEARALEFKQSNFELQKQIADLTKQATAPLDDIVSKLKDQVAFEREYGELIKNGTNPELAKQIIEINRAYEASAAALVPALAAAQAAVTRAEAEGASATEIQKYREELERIQEIQSGLPAKKTDAIGAATELAKPKTDQQNITEKIGTLKDEIADLTSISNIAITSAAGIGDAFAMSFKGIIDGSMTAKEALANFFTSVADMFLDMAAQIITQMITMAILNAVLGVLPGGDPAKAGGDWISAVERLSPNADGNAFGANGIIPFAKGGIVNSPTVFPFAKGVGLMGEAGPEAILPLKRGADGSLGVMASGGGGNTNVVVNVDAKGSSVEGDEQGANQLGRVISAAVQSELIKQQRPGGILAR